MMKNRTILYLAFAISGLFVACDRTKDPIYEKLSDDRLPVIVANTNFLTPAVPTGGYVKCTAVKIEFNFLPTDPIKELQLLEKIGTADSVVVFSTPYAPAFSKTKNCDTLVYNYTVPSTPAVGTSVTLRERVINVNGLVKDRAVSYLIK